MEELAFDLPDGAVALLGPVSDYPLLPAEAACVAAASPVRRRQFASGRHLARTALGRLQSGNDPILQHGRQPVWPQGFIGSISHAQALAAVVAARCGVLSALGVDIERANRLKAALHSRVLTKRERQRPWADEREGAMAFSAKEAGYKAVNPLTGLFIGFREVEVIFDWPGSAFRLRYLGHHEANRMLHAGAGRFMIHGDHLITLFHID